MKRVIICNIPMKPEVENIVLTSNDKSLPVSDKPYRYPINSFLSQTVKEGDEFKVILLIKKDGNPYYEKNTEDFRKEFESILAIAGTEAEYSFVDTEYKQNRVVHEQLMGRLIDEMEDGAHVLADITYGSKDVPIVVFTVLNFAERFLDCKIDNIIYGLADFKDNKVIASEICDMIPLYCLSTVTDAIKCNDAQKARQLLKSLLSL